MMSGPKIPDWQDQWSSSKTTYEGVQPVSHRLSEEPAIKQLEADVKRLSDQLAMARAFWIVQGLVILLILVTTYD